MLRGEELASSIQHVPVPHQASVPSRKARTSTFCTEPAGIMIQTPDSLVYLIAPICVSKGVSRENSDRADHAQASKGTAS